MKILDTETFEKLLQKKKQKIGSGATSNVYKVRNIFKSEGFLAIKILNDIFFELMKSTPIGNKEKKIVWDDDDNNFDDVIEEEEDREIPIEEVRKIFKEWEILSQLDHPNIIKIYGFYNGNRSHSPSIVLEYCKFNLKNAISHLENIFLVKVVYQICNAMQYLHDKKMIHRDLKVNNILINSQKNVKICDFGISKYIDVTTLTSMAHGIGTFIYMAPELFDPESKLDEKIDVYAFDVVLYFIATKGEIPKLLHNYILEDFDIPINVNKLSKSIIKKCWSFQPKERPSFKSIMDTIVSNNFSLFDDINESISSLGF